MGGGVVADSSPEDEYLESLDKARAPLRALERALERAQEGEQERVGIPVYERTEEESLAKGSDEA